MAGWRQTISNSSQQANQWEDLRDTLKERYRSPLRSPSFVLYFIVVIIILGGAGFWESTIMYQCFPDAKVTPLRTWVSSGYTFYLAIAATAALDLCLATPEKKLLMFSVLCAVLVAVSAIFSIVFSSIESTPFATLFLILGIFVALSMWWIANAYNPNLLDTPPTAATGGDPTQELSGDTEGFQT